MTPQGKLLFDACRRIKNRDADEVVEVSTSEPSFEAGRQAR